MTRAFNPDQLKTRSFQSSDWVWDSAKVRAGREGVTMSSAIRDLLEGYARGVYNLPTQRIVRNFDNVDPQSNES